MRVLLATEGPGDEEVAARLIRRCLGQVTIKSMSLPARGLSAILRQVSDFVRAAYFGHYDLLVVHFDMDDTLPDGFTYARQSTRWIDINLRIGNTLAGLTHPSRSAKLKIVLMTPRRAVEAWLSWGRNNKSGRMWEDGDTRILKRQLFGNPPRRVPEQTELYARDLIDQVQKNDDWPVTLRWFVLDVHGVGSAIQEFAMGVNGKLPKADVVDVAARVVQAAVAYTIGPHITVDDEDGDLDIHLRLTDGLIVMANLFPDGTIDASVYDESQLPVKTVKRMRRSTTSPEELISLFEKGGCSATE